MEDSTSDTAESSEVTSEEASKEDNTTAEDGSETVDRGNETTTAEDETTKTEEETTVTEETTVMTDVMIGETIDAEYASDFSVAKIFSDDMVVQRNEFIRVWGFAPESENGKKVSGEFKGMFAEAIIENGEWCITFGARLSADVNGAEMKIYTDSKTVCFNGVLVGDVYIVMGQSNVAYSVNDHIGYTDAATQGGGKDAIDPSSIIRLNFLNGSGGTYSNKGTDYVYSDLRNTSFWKKTTEQDTLVFSALGYYFATQMVEKNPSVPIGLMEVAVAGAPIVSFLPNDLADEFGGDYKDRDSGIYYSTLSTNHMGRYLYNCYLAPISKYAIAGVLWYQGSSNNTLQEAVKYNQTFASFIERLRYTHNVSNKKFPVFIVEPASIYQKPDSYTGTWYFMELGIIRAFTGSIPTVLENSYVAVSCDLWADRTFFNSLHPNCKYEHAQRLAAIADVVVNKNGTLDAATGPILESASISSDKKTVTITFTNVGDGITTKDGGEAVLGFVGLADTPIGHSPVEPTSATITGKNQITVVFDTAVKAVAYNYVSENYYGETVNLCNSNGCPASAFITAYKDIDLTGYKDGELISITDPVVALKGKSYDTLTAAGANLLNVGSIDSQLAAIGNIVDVYAGTPYLGMFGWAGFGYEVLMFGYSIDGGNVVFNTYPDVASQGVINAGGQLAKRFTVHMDISELAVGEHSVTLAALVNVNGGVGVKMLSFKINVVEKPSGPDGIDLPMYSDGEYGLIRVSFDQLKLGNQEIYLHDVKNKIEAAGNIVSAKKGTTSLSIAGWAGFEATIDKLGYSIDGNAAVLLTTPTNPESTVTDLGGKNAKRFNVIADISNLDVGLHTFELLIRLNTDGGQTTLKLLSFTLEITE